MFSAFSFGKIIKTILPGVLLTAALLMLMEGFWALWKPGEGFLLEAVPKEWVTPVTAALIPVSLILGFFLNTFVWMVLNPQMRACSDAALSGTIYTALRQKLSEGLWTGSTGYFAKLGRPLGPASPPDRPPLEYYYLPSVTLTHLNYLWESYFCWYEFDINSAYALWVLVPAATFLLWAKLRPNFLPFFLVALLLLVVSAALYRMLRAAAVRNLVSYERNLMLLITASLAKSAKDAKSTAMENADETAV
jgi:hypothetical protein